MDATLRTVGRRERLGKIDAKYDIDDQIILKVMGVNVEVVEAPHSSFWYICGSHVIIHHIPPAVPKAVPQTHLNPPVFMTLFKDTIE